MTADLLALLDRDPAAGILAVADLREQQAQHPDADRAMRLAHQYLRVALQRMWMAGYIAAEANPAHALAAVRRWRGVVDRHGRYTDDGVALVCRRCGETWQCPDFRETADEARAYLGGTA